MLKYKILLFVGLVASCLVTGIADAEVSDETLSALAIQVSTEKGSKKEVALEQLAKVGVAAAPFVANLIPAKDAATRDAATRLIDRFGKKAVIEHCIKTLNSKNEKVRNSAANALSMLTDYHFGCSPNDTPEQRAQIIDKWTKWLAKWEKDNAPQTSVPPHK